VGEPFLGGPDDELCLVDLGMRQPSDAWVDPAVHREGGHGSASAVAGTVPVRPCGQMRVTELLLAEHAPEQIVAMLKHIGGALFHLTVQFLVVGLGTPRILHDEVLVDIPQPQLFMQIHQRIIEMRDALAVRGGFGLHRLDREGLLIPRPVADDALHRTGPIGEHPVDVMDLRTAIQRYAHQQK